MKKILAFSLCFCLIFALCACGSNKNVSESSKYLSIAKTSDKDNKYKLNEEDSKTISEMISSLKWDNAIGNCKSDIIIFYNDIELEYHTECGTANDMKNKRSIVFGKDIKEKANEIFAKYMK